MEAANRLLLRATRSSSTRTTPTARATPTAVTRTTSSTGRPFLQDRPRADSAPGVPSDLHRSRKIGEEVPHGGDVPPFQLSQRADFFEEEVGLETTLKRPIINTRDEPHADPHKYRRLHVIVGDANLAEIATSSS